MAHPSIRIAWGRPGAPLVFALATLVTCTLDGTKTWRRCVAICRVDGQDVAEQLVRMGRARDCRRFSEGRYAAAEQAAADDGATIREEVYADLPGYCERR